MAESEESLVIVSDSTNIELTLEECFKKIIGGHPLELDLSNIFNILNKDLQISTSSTKAKIKVILPYMLVHFMKSWPGWQKASSYASKQITIESWYNRFREYLIFKINYMIMNDFDKVLVMLKKNQPIDESVLFKIDDNTQTNSVVESYAPYSIVVEGFPKLLNTLLFCEGPKDKVILKEYRVHSKWDKELTIRQLINWPCVEIQFRSKELHFDRKNMHDFKRYITLSTEKLVFKKTDAFIEEIEIINEQITRRAYTLNLMKEYCYMYNDVLKKHQVVLGLTDTDINEIRIILEDFLLDIAELNMDSIATNTSVLFNIGHFVYARNKSIKTGDQATSICLAESLTPKIQISLLNFSAVKDVNSRIQFEYLNDINNTTDLNLIRNLRPFLNYCCTFCNITYNTKKGIWQHLQKKHIMEQPVLCFHCKLQFNITDLSENRWRHQCTRL